MAEEQFTSRRARREAERLAADQAFEARETPEQPSEPEPNGREALLDTPQAPASGDDAPAAPEGSDDGSGAPEPHRTDPTSDPLPHFDSRVARKSYLREHGLSSKGDISTGATPVVAGPDQVDEDEYDSSAPTESGSTPDEHESYDEAGFGGSAGEVAARDFEAPVTPASAPRPTALDDEPDDALSRPLNDNHTLRPNAPKRETTPDTGDEPAQSREISDGPAAAPAPDHTVNRGPAPAEDRAAADSTRGIQVPADAPSAESSDEEADESSTPSSRSRRMPIVQPPSTSGVRVVTAASAKIPGAERTDSGNEVSADDTVAASEGLRLGAPGSTADETSRRTTDQDFGPAAPKGGANSGRTADREVDGTDHGFEAEDSSAGGQSSDDAARALAANPETRPMETVPEAWALPNPNYEDEETENPPGTRIRASSVTGNDGRILVGEEPSKVPYVVLGVAALFAVALIVIALVMLL